MLHREGGLILRVFVELASNRGHLAKHLRSTSHSRFHQIGTVDAQVLRDRLQGRCCLRLHFRKVAEDTLEPRSVLEQCDAVDDDGRDVSAEEKNLTAGRRIDRASTDEQSNTVACASYDLVSAQSLTSRASRPT